MPWYPHRKLDKTFGTSMLFWRGYLSEVILKEVVWSIEVSGGPRENHDHRSFGGRGVGSGGSGVGLGGPNGAPGIDGPVR